MATKDVLYLYTKTQGQFLFTVEQNAIMCYKENVNLSKVVHTLQNRYPVVKKLKSAAKRNSHIPVNSFNTSPFDVTLAVCCKNGIDLSM